MNGTAWQKVRLGTCVTIRTGDSPSVHTLSKNQGVPFVKVEDMNNCRKYQSTSREFIVSNAEPIPKGSVIFPKRGAAIMNNKIRITSVPLCVDTNMMALTVNAEKLDAEYLFYVLDDAKLYRIADTSTIPQLNNKHINPLQIHIPPLPEQRKIASIVSTWDRAIELTEKLAGATKLRKQALMQQLLAGKARLRGFGDQHWKRCQLGDVATNSTSRNETAINTLQVYSVTNRVGMIPMSVDVIGESIDRYKTVGKRDFAYNPMRINVGSIAMWHGDEDVLVSPDYVVFRCGGELDAEFLNHFRKTHYWNQFVNRSGGGSVRVRIYFSDLAAMPLNLPPLPEQKAIAAVLNSQDREIDLLQRKLDALRRQKKGLMQQLLTGKLRVNVKETSWG